MACAICETRKEKRFCPAVHGRICPTCCGTEREVTLDCPGTCPYLQQARRSERPRTLSEEERAAMFPDVKIPRDLPQTHEPLLTGLTFSLVQCARKDRALLDRDVLAALTALAKTYSTLANSGLVYEEPVSNPVQQGIIFELRTMIQSLGDAEKKQFGRVRTRDSELLQVVVFMMWLAWTRSNGRPRSRAFLDSLEQSFPPSDSVLAGPQDPGSRLIIP